MSLLNEVTTGIQIPAIKINISGTDGIGKTTFASQAPKPIQLYSLRIMEVEMKNLPWEE